MDAIDIHEIANEPTILHVSHVVFPFNFKIITV